MADREKCGPWEDAVARLTNARHCVVGQDAVQSGLQADQNRRPEPVTGMLGCEWVSCQSGLDRPEALKFAIIAYCSKLGAQFPHVFIAHQSP